MNTTTDQPDVDLSVAPPLGAADPPDPESHEPPRHLDSSEEVPVLRGDDIDPDETMPTAGGDGKPAGVAEGQDDEDDDDLTSWADKLTRAAVDRSLHRQEEYLRVLAVAEERYPNAEPVKREMWAKATVNLPQSVRADGRKLFLTKAAFEALKARLDATNVALPDALDPDGSLDIDELVREADALPEESDESEAPRSDWDEPEGGHARVIPENEPSYKLDGVFAFKVAQALWMSGYASSPRDFDTAVACLRREYPEMSENRRLICAYALSGHTEYPIEGESERAAIDLTHIEAWVAEVLDSRRRREETREAFGDAVTAAVEAQLPRAVRRFTARLETPWYKSPEGIAAIGAVALVILFFSALVVKEERELSRFEERRDAAAKEIGTVYDKDGKLVEVTTFEELAAATGFPTDPTARELRLMAASASHEARLRTIESKRDELNKERDDAVAQAALEGDKRVRTETAFDAFQELRREEQNDHAMRLGELERSLSRAERLLGVATADVEAARILYKDHVRAGRCGNPLDEEYPQDASSSRAHYKCDFGRVVCAGRLPSEADNCRRIER